MALEPQTSLERLELGADDTATALSPSSEEDAPNKITTATSSSTHDEEVAVEDKEASDENAKSTSDQPQTEEPSSSVPPSNISDRDASAGSGGYNTDTTAEDESAPMLDDAKNTNGNDDALSVSSSSDTDSVNAASSPDQASDLLVTATSLKDEGNAHFKAGDFDKAARSYRRGCSSLKKLLNYAGDDQVRSCWVALQTNLSMVLLKQGKHKQSATVASKVLEREPTHVKALYRRALAYRQMGHLEEARDDLRAAVRVEPNNAACKKELLAIKKELEQTRESQKKALAKAFSNKSSSLLYDDKEEAERRKEEKKRLEKQAQQELYKKRKQEWEDECVKRMARNEPAITFEEWETEQKEEEKKKKQEEEKARKAREKQRKEELRRKRLENAQADKDSDSDDDDDDVLTEKELAMMRGYKKTKDGRITSYFTRELSEEEKKVYDTAPKRLNEVSNTAPTRLVSSDSLLSASEIKGHSAWNLAGTWEEKDTSVWCTEQLRKRLEDVAFCTMADTDYDVHVVKVDKLEGHASVAMTSGKKRYIFEYEASLKYEIKSEHESVVASGVAQLPDISSIHLDDELEIAFDPWTQRPGADVESKALKARSNFVDQIRLQVQQWVQDFNEQY